MSNAEFRAMFAKNQARAVALLEVRVSALTVWQPSEKARAFRWFGRNDEATRTILLTGLSKVLNVVKKMNERNVVRTGSDIDHATGCTPHPIGVSREAAHVCAPDTSTHTISISGRFCTMRDWSAYADSRVSTIIHEASHFLDTMATTDEKYTITPQLQDWGRLNSNKAIRNADSIAGYVVDGD